MTPAISKFIAIIVLPLALATPPGIPSVSTATSQLAELTVSAGSQDGYDRDLFPHWITKDGYVWTSNIVEIYS